MPKITIELTNDKLHKIIDILLQNDIKFLVSPDKKEVVVTDYERKVFNEVLESLDSVIPTIRNVEPNLTRTGVPKHVEPRTTGKKIPDYIMEYFTENPNAVCSSEALFELVESKGFKASSVSGALTTLYNKGALIRIKEGRYFYYSLSRTDTNAKD